MSHLVLLRHGESEWNARDLFTGWVDVGLTAKGRSKSPLTIPSADNYARLW